MPIVSQPRYSVSPYCLPSCSCSTVTSPPKMRTCLICTVLVLLIVSSCQAKKPTKPSKTTTVKACKDPVCYKKSGKACVKKEEMKNDKACADKPEKGKTVDKEVENGSGELKCGMKYLFIAQIVVVMGYLHLVD